MMFLGKVKRALELSPQKVEKASTKAKRPRAQARKRNLRTRSVTMEEDEEDIYAPEYDPEAEPIAATEAPVVKDEVMKEQDQEGEEEEEEEEEEGDEDDSDIEIVTERKEGEKPEPVRPLRNESYKSSTTRAEAPQAVQRAGQSPAIKLEARARATPPPSKPGSSYPAVRTSSLDVDAKPIHEPSGKPITEVDLDADFEDDKPWRRPGSDMTDYFNYGFDEFTWASYCLKQEALRKEAKEQKKQVEEMQNFFNQTAAPVAAPAGMPPMAGPQDMTPDMQQMMQTMMASGMDPSQLDFNTFMQMMNQGGQGVGQQGFGQQGPAQQQMGGFGYGSGSGSGHGGSGNRGRGGRRW